MSRANPPGSRLKAIAVVYWRLTNSPATRGSRCDTHNAGTHYVGTYYVGTYYVGNLRWPFSLQTKTGGRAHGRL